MNNTVCITIKVGQQNLKDELIALLSAAGFDAFEEKDDELLAYTDEISFRQTGLENVLGPYKVSYTTTTIEAQNWNEPWESNFAPVVVDNFCAVRAAFHKPFEDMEYEVVITPKMSFGTGHHATTYMMLGGMRHLNFNNMAVADFGTGTGVLAILAEKMGSSFIWAVDNDEWSITNAAENITTNSCSKISLEKADGFMTSQKFDIILANINKAVILASLNNLVNGLKEQGRILISGLLKEDEDEMVSAFAAKGLALISIAEKNNWICMLYKHAN